MYKGLWYFSQACEGVKGVKEAAMKLLDVPCQKETNLHVKIDICRIDHSQWTHCVIKRQNFETQDEKLVP